MNATLVVHPNKAVVVVATDLLDGESFTVYFSLDRPSDKSVKFIPYTPGAEPVQLTVDKPMAILALPGTYQVLPDAPVLKATVDASDEFVVQTTVGVGL